MGQAWCKEKSTKAQDSKSPLDRVFLRCAHRIYPGLKEEGSVLGGATQRVTSSEIGYASSPPREVLTRGQSIDSVDRPFHPSDWVDVNLEVPGTPRVSSTMTNLTLDTTRYPSTTLASTNSSGSNMRDFAPVPPPRRRKKNRGRPLPPKPDQVSGNQVDRVAIPKRSFRESRDSSHEPLYSSVKSRDPSRSNKIEIYEHKVNGTGRIIPSSVVAGHKSKRENSSRRVDDDSEKKSLRPKNSSTVSLPNYSELEVTNTNVQGEDEEDLKIYKITAAGSLPALITSGVIETIVKSDAKQIEKTVVTTESDKNELPRSIDEVDFTFDVSKNLDTLNNIYKLEGPKVTSTPVKNGFDNDSRTPTTGGGWFLHQDSDSKFGECDYCPRESTWDKNDTDSTEFFDTTKNSRSDTFFEAEEDRLEENVDNHARVERGAELVSDKLRRRTSLKRTLSNESEPFDSYEEKELREPALVGVRSNSQVKLVGRSISDESLPEEMLADQDDPHSLGDKEPIEAMCVNGKIDKNLVLEHSEKSDDTKTPPPSPEPKIKPEFNDNDHSTLLKVLRDEAEESNLSSMTPSLTELEAALSDMLEREDDDQSSDETSKVPEKIVSIDNTSSEKALEAPIEPKIVHNDIDKNAKHSAVSVSLKNILGDPDDMKIEKKSTEKIEEDVTKMTEIDLTNGDNYFDRREPRNSLADFTVDGIRNSSILAMEPPEKPSRLHQVSLGESSKISEKVPTPPRRRNRSSIGANKDNFRGSLDRAETPENPFPNDRLI